MFSLYLLLFIIIIAAYIYMNYNAHYDLSEAILSRLKRREDLTELMQLLEIAGVPAEGLSKNLYQPIVWSDRRALELIREIVRKKNIHSIYEFESRVGIKSHSPVHELSRGEIADNPELLPE